MMNPVGASSTTCVLYHRMALNSSSEKPSSCAQMFSL
jgi:hypothetical protein